MGYISKSIQWKCEITLNGMERCRMAWYGMVWNGMVWYGMNGREYSFLETRKITLDGTRCILMEWDGL